MDFFHREETPYGESLYKIKYLQYKKLSPPNQIQSKRIESQLNSTTHPLRFWRSQPWQKLGFHFILYFFSPFPIPAISSNAMDFPSLSAWFIFLNLQQKQQPNFFTFQQESLPSSLACVLYQESFSNLKSSEIWHVQSYIQMTDFT